MNLTDEQLVRLRQTIEDAHTAFAIKIYGRKVVPPEVYDRLKAAGLVTDKDGQAAQDSYAYGKVLQALNTPQAANMSFADFQGYLRKHPIPLTDAEQRAVGIAAARGAQYIRGLGNKISTETGQLVINADAEQRRRLQGEIKTEVAQGIANRQTRAEIKSNIGHKTGDWTRDLDRIAATEVSVAMNEGLASQLQQEQGNDVEVAVRSRRGCCPQCEAAYKGPDGAPIIFRLADLQGNGTNVGKKRADQVPVVPPYHPNCVREGTLILTAEGPERVEYVAPGTFVYTHRGRLRPVTHAWTSAYEGPMTMVATQTGFTLALTPNHAVRAQNDWIAAGAVAKSTQLQKVSRVYHAPYEAAPGPTDVLDVLYGACGKLPIMAIVLPTGVYLGEGAYLKGGDKMAVRAALRGKLTFCNPAGLPAIYPTEDAVLSCPDFGDVSGGPIRLVRADKLTVQVVHQSQDYFRNHHRRSESARRHAAPPAVDVLLPRELGDGVLQFTCMVTLRTDMSRMVQKLDGISPGDAPSGQCEFEAEQPLDVYIRPHKGMVYNLTVAEDESYVAQGIVVHNCACTLVHVPKGHGFNADNRMTPMGKKGIRPHMDTVKGLGQHLLTLSKAQKSAQTPPGWHDWYGLALTNVRPAHRPNHYKATLRLPTGDAACLVGPDLQASRAHVVHLPTGDIVCLGFHQPEQAFFSLCEALHIIAPPMGPQWSSIPVFSLAAQVGLTCLPGETFRPAPDEMTKAGLASAGPIRVPKLALPDMPKRYRTLNARGPAQPSASSLVLPHEAVKQIREPAKPGAAKPVEGPPKMPRAPASGAGRSAPVAPATRPVASIADAQSPKKPRSGPRRPVLRLPD